jgi:tetratricopeptide (TPR) repeat protein
VQEFLNDYPCQLPEDIPLISMMADLNFGPLNDPVEGAAVCRDILKVTVDHRESHQRLVFFYAMTHQQVAMQSQIQATLKSDCELPEVFVYSFLGSGLRLSNGITMTERWLKSSPTSELLLVARALHFSQSVSGAIPTADEKAAEEVRQMQNERASKLQELLSKYPHNQELLAYHLQESIQEGAALRVGELLTQSPPEADLDYRFWHARGWVFARLAEFEEAERCYRKALALHSLDWRTQFHLAELLRATGRLNESDRASQLAADGRAIERDLLEQPDMQSIPMEIYQRLAEYSQRCKADLYTKRLRQYLDRSGFSESGSLE